MVEILVIFKTYILSGTFTENSVCARVPDSLVEHSLFSKLIRVFVSPRHVFLLANPCCFSCASEYRCLSPFVVPSLYGSLVTYDVHSHVCVYGRVLIEP